MEHELSDPVHWRGGWHYELALELSRTALDASGTVMDGGLRQTVFRAVWESPPLTGVVDEWGKVGRGWLPLESVSVTSGKHYYGLLRLDAAHTIGCGSTFVDDGSILWFVLYIPLGMLESIYPVAHPFHLSDNPWHIKIDDLLIAVARRVFPLVGYRLAAIGQEASAGLSLALHTETQFRWMAPCLLVPAPLLSDTPASASSTLLPEGIWLLKHE